MSFLLLKYVHVLGATLLLGTGIGIAFFMLMAHRSGNPAIIAHTARIVVIADILFTASAVILQPVTGYFLMRSSGHSLTESWLAVSLTLYVLAGAFWLPVLWLQARMRDLAAAAANAQELMPSAYHQLFMIWLAFGFPAFGAVLVILALMIFQPVLY